MSEPSKETIYVDIDDEITAIIEKVRGASGKIVALVLPKRAAVLQSVVNMKLLKRTAEDAKKNLVLVTSEASLMPLAGTVGLHVASTPTSKPSIPAAPAGPGDDLEDIDEPLDIAGDETANTDFDSTEVAAKPVGELAGGVAGSKVAPGDVDEELTMDDDASPGAGPAKSAAATAKAKKNKKLKIPNFDSFRTKLLLGAGILVVLILGYVLAFVILPHATVTIHTDTTTITSNLNLTLDSAAKTLDPAAKVVPAVSQSTQKSSNQQVAATGQQNNGTKAQGSVTMSAGSCSGNVPNGVDAGTSLSANSHTYILGESVSFAPTVSHGHCTFTGIGSSSGNGNVAVTALRGGADYNTSSATFSVSGRSDVAASGSVSGGTDNIVKVVSQSDIDGAKAKISAQDTTAIKQDLQSGLQGKDLDPVPATFVASDPQVTSSAKAGDTADSVTVTEIVTYTMLGVKHNDLKTLIDNNVTGQLDKGKQSILDDGLSKAKITATSPATPTGAAITLQAKSIAGPQIDTAKLRTQVAGMKSGEIKDTIKQTPGVTDVDVKYSPFWVGSTPKSAAKITVQLDKSNTGNQ